MAEDRFLTVDEIAERMRVSPYTVYDWLRSGRLKGFRPGGKRAGWRISEGDLRQFIADRRGEQGEQPED